MSTRRTCDMTAGASGALVVNNIRDWGCELAAGSNWDASEENGAQIDLAIDFYHATWANPIRKIITISNTVSSRLSRNGAPTGIDDLIVKDTISTAGLFTTAIAAWRAAANKNARQKALADALIAAGVIHANLSGTTS